MSKHIIFIEASGTGAGEVANRLAKSRDCFVTLITRNPKSYSDAILKNVDQLVVCETNNVDILIDRIRELAKERPIDGITTTADFYVPQAAKAAQDLGLPSLTYKAASEVRNKYKMRLNIEKFCPSLNPPFQLVQDAKEALEVANKWGFPIIAKPQDGNDSLNVKLIRNEPDIVDYMNSSRTWNLNSAGQPFAKGVLLEGFIDGQEFSVETMQPKGGDIQLIGVTRNVLTGFDRGHFVELGASFPTRTKEAEILFTAVADALSKLDIDCGVIHTECRLQDGKPKILEINPRLIGDKVGSHVIELALGINPVQAVIDIALGDAKPWQPIYNDGAAIYGICMPKSGIFCGIDNIEELKGMPGVVYVELTVPLETWISETPISNGDVVALVITKAKTPEEALELAKMAAQRAKVSVTN